MMEQSAFGKNENLHQISLFRKPQWNRIIYEQSTKVNESTTQSVSCLSTRFWGGFRLPKGLLSPLGFPMRIRWVA